MGHSIGRHDSAIVRRILAAALPLSLAACSGGGGSPPPASTSSGGGSAPQASLNAPVTFQMQWASPTTPSAKARRPQYLAPTALSVSINVISAPAPWTTATPIVEVLNSPTSTITFTAPTGLDTFAIQTYDEQNAKGNVLSSAFVTQTVSGTSANVVSAILNGVLASMTLNVSPLQPTGGVPSTMTVSATGLDADGNVIVGPGTYASPIQLAINDPSNSGTLSLSPAVIQAPGGTATLSYSGQPLASASVVATAAGVATPSSVTIKPTPTAYYYSPPTANSGPTFMTVDASNNVWFSESTANKIGEFSGGSTITETTIPTANSYPQGITVGSDGRIWFAELNGQKLGALRPGGAITEYPTLFGSPDDPIQLVDRGDGNMWYTGSGADRIGYVFETTGATGETTLPESPGQVFPFGIARASDGYIYFTEAESSKIGRLYDLGGTVQEILLTAPSGSSSGVSPGPMVTGPDGNLWFVDTPNGEIGRVNIPAFTVTFFQTTSPTTFPNTLTVGPDGALWYTEQGVDRIGRMTTSGVATDYTLGQTGLGLNGIAIRSNGSVFFSCEATGKIGKLII
jgi:virginiamycin B lyase